MTIPVGTQIPGPAGPAGATRRGQRIRAAAWALVGVSTAAVVAVPARLPFYDYAEWLLQGRIVHEILTGGTVDGQRVTEIYSLLPVPVPNLAAPAGIALLNLVLPIEVAGRVFLLLGCLGFVAGYAFLVRRLQGRPTVLEYTGPIWVLGYFLDRGYVSYLFGLPLAFVGIAALQPVLAGRPLSRRRACGIAALGLLTFLAHLIPWGVLVLAVLMHAVVLARRARRREAAALVATCLPAVVLLAWYAAAAPVDHHLSFYTSLRDKALALAEPFQAFLRLDPFPSVVPTTVIEVVVVLGLVGLAVDGLRARRRDLAHPVVLTAALLAVVAVLDPVGNVNSLTKPDQRLVFPAVLMLLAALRWKRATAGRRGVVVAAVVLLAGLHLVQLLAVQSDLRDLTSAARRVVPPTARVATDAVSVDGGCGSTVGPTIGLPALKWVDVDRLLASGQLRADLQETSGIALRPGLPPAGLTPLNSAPDRIGAAIAAAGSPPYVEVFACPTDLRGVPDQLGDGYGVAAAGSNYLILERQAAG
ncbi:hypothetical protein LWC33_22515 [Pseudonocardia sp. RS11V-5]|uniref:hypothetical protein n=1 Tax=Pseudonocardia terrae TaxID=2905831 RepID=UPI001E542FB0|nr:hypothetical protein [Pseudonocardia terrae]MCE3554213.1 hypothetical protein [Pseudonocardia terrae]